MKQNTSTVFQGDNNDNKDISPYFTIPFELQDHELKQGFVQYSRRFLSNSFSLQVFNNLMNNISFSQSSFKVQGREYQTPREQAWMADKGVIPQLYSKKESEPWSDDIKIIKEKLEELTNFTFDYVLINLYRNENDYIAYHSDSEANGDNRNIIASVSLGASRKFILRHKKWKEQNIQKKAFMLSNGSLIIMKGNDTQRYWKHTVPKTRLKCGPRINLTFRHS